MNIVSTIGMIEKCQLIVPQAYLDIEKFKLDRDMKMLKNQGVEATIQALRSSSSSSSSSSPQEN